VQRVYENKFRRKIIKGETCSYAIILHNFYVRQTRQHLTNAR